MDEGVNERREREEGRILELDYRAERLTDKPLTLARDTWHKF